MSVKFKDLDTCSSKFHESKNGKKDKKNIK